MMINGIEYNSLAEFCRDNKFSCKNCAYKYYNDYRQEDYCRRSLDPCRQTVYETNPRVCLGYCSVDGFNSYTAEPVYYDFTDDHEKMRDFFALTKEEFLASYSYLDEQEYDLTAAKVKEEEEFWKEMKKIWD